jgi:SAM-dependent methyltransferase
MHNKCPLCTNESSLFYQKNDKIYYQCINCFGIFIEPNHRLDKIQEKLHYETHINDVDDIRYQNFVSPITSAILNDFNPQSKGLDFGAGTGPVISKVLKDNGFSIRQYDPFFHNFPELLKFQYDFIACCEVMEHFHSPQKEFELLKKMLLPNGKLYCMTELYNDNINFGNWYYKNDPTHVFIYHQKSIEFIKEHFHFSDVLINKRLIIFAN